MNDGVFSLASILILNAFAMMFTSIHNIIIKDIKSTKVRDAKT